MAITLSSWKLDSRERAAPRFAAAMTRHLSLVKYVLLSRRLI